MDRSKCVCIYLEALVWVKRKYIDNLVNVNERENISTQKASKRINWLPVSAVRLWSTIVQVDYSILATYPIALVASESIEASCSCKLKSNGQFNVLIRMIFQSVVLTSYQNFPIHELKQLFHISLALMGLHSLSHPEKLNAQYPTRKK